jgi:hypothetical protein
VGRRPPNPESPPGERNVQRCFARSPLAPPTRCRQTVRMFSVLVIQDRGAKLWNTKAIPVDAGESLRERARNPSSASQSSALMRSRWDARTCPDA